MTSQLDPVLAPARSPALAAAVRIATALAIVSAVGITLLPAVPSLHPVPYRDSGVFLYVGQRILHGDMPYRDVWDHKPPGIHLVNAIGLAVAGGSMWGVWTIQALTLITAALLGWRVLAAMSSTTAAAVGTLSWLSALPFALQLGNFTEEYALPLQIGAILLYGNAVRSDVPRRSHLAGIGALGAALVLLRPNLAGLPAVAALLLILSPRLDGGSRRRAGAALAVGAGAMAVFAPILAWLACRSALADFVDAVVRYNLAYSNASWADRISAIGFGFELLSPAVTPWLAAIGWFATLVLLARPGPRSSGPKRRLAALIAIAAPCEVILAALPGRDYEHYFRSWLPVGALCVATLADAVLGVRWTLGRKVLLAAVFIAVAIGLTQAARQLRGQLLTPSADRRIQETVDYIAPEVDRSDTVLVWGAEATVNFLTGCPAPTRFVYQYPLFTSGYTRVQLFEEMMSDLRLRPPLFVIDASSSNPIIPSLAEGAGEPTARPSPVYTIPAEVDQIRRWIHDNYLPVHRVGGWIVLRSRLASPDVSNLPAGSAQPRPVP